MFAEFMTQAQARHSLPLPGKGISSQLSGSLRETEVPGIRPRKWRKQARPMQPVSPPRHLLESRSHWAPEAVQGAKGSTTGNSERGKAWRRLQWEEIT